MKKSILYLSLSSLVLFSACSSSISGNGTVKEVNKKIKEFTEIQVSGNFSVFIEKSKDNKMILEMDENLLENTIVNVSSGEIKISEKQNVADFEKQNIYLYTNDLTAIELSDNVKLKCNSIFNEAELEVENSGNTELNFIGNLKELDLDLSGNSTATFNGEAYQLMAELSGNSSLEAISFPAKLVKIELSGNANAQVEAISELDGTASGNAILKYKGHPEKSIDVSGNAEINRID